MDVFVARQPIFNVKSRVVAYELLFRSSLENCFPAIDKDLASARNIADSVLSLGLNKLTGRKRAFVNFTRKMLLSGIYTLLPKQKVVVEILEDVEPDEEVVNACRILKRRGYMLALDDFVFEEKAWPLVKLADIIKIDFQQTPPAERRKLCRLLLDTRIKSLAEKVESRQEFEEALELECSYIQGYFFAKPVVVSARSIPIFKLNYAQLLQEAHRKDFDLRRLEKLIKADLSLSHGLLKLVNSAAFYFVRHIHSIRQALVLIGQRNVRKMVTLVAMSQMAHDKPQELVVNSMIRAAFCESLGEAAGMRNSKDDLFLMGMFSMIDAILDQPLAEALCQLPLSDEVKSSLLGERDNRYQKILQLAVSFEKAEWERFQSAARQIGLDEPRVPELYRNAVQWVDRLQDAALTVVPAPRPRSLSDG